MKRRILTAAISASVMLLLILKPNIAIAGAKDGIDLCIKTVIPSLFPYFVLSALLTNAMTGIHAPIFAPLGRLCGIPQGSEILLLTGLLGGYPVGAQAVTQAWRNGQLSTQDARRMLGFCSNAGPAFFFGILTIQFQSRLIVVILWMIHTLSAILVGALLPGRNRAKILLPPADEIGISGAVRRSVGVTATVCAWIVLFRIILAFLGALLPMNAAANGLLELANGCCDLWRIDNITARFLTASVMLAFGGVCVCMQTVSATSGLGLGMYLPGKLLQSAFSAALSLLISPVLFEDVVISDAMYLMLIPVEAAILLFLKKRVAFRREMVYN